jgi:hypothetical protein
MLILMAGALLAIFQEEHFLLTAGEIIREDVAAIPKLLDE